jgi:hypothetical protein
MRPDAAGVGCRRWAPLYENSPDMMLGNRSMLLKEVCCFMWYSQVVVFVQLLEYTLFCGIALSEFARTVTIHYRLLSHVNING